MPGITAYGAYIPLHRLSRAEIARAWGGKAAPGERAVASYDEDSLTMAVAAARDCLRDADRATVGAVYFASTTAPYKEKQSAADHRVGAGPAAGHGDRGLRRLAALRHQRPQGGAGRGGGRERAERAGLRRGHAPRATPPAPAR